MFSSSVLFHQYAKNHELRFSDLTFDDSGMYQCFAENRHGTIYANAELRVFGEYSSLAVGDMTNILYHDNDIYHNIVIFFCYFFFMIFKSLIP